MCIRDRIYELACLKVYAEPLLFGIAKDEPEYTEAKRLLKFFEYFVPVPSEAVPNNSILREFIGGRDVYKRQHMIQSQDTGNFPGDFVYVLPAFLIIHNKLILFP